MVLHGSWHHIELLAAKCQQDDSTDCKEFTEPSESGQVFGVDIIVPLEIGIEDLLIPTLTTVSLAQLNDEELFPSKDR